MRARAKRSARTHPRFRSTQTSSYLFSTPSADTNTNTPAPTHPHVQYNGDGVVRVGTRAPGRRCEQFALLCLGFALKVAARAPERRYTQFALHGSRLCTAGCSARSRKALHTDCVAGSRFCAEGCCASSRNALRTVCAEWVQVVRRELLRALQAGVAHSWRCKV